MLDDKNLDETTNNPMKADAAALTGITKDLQKSSVSVKILQIRAPLSARNTQYQDASSLRQPMN